MVIPMFSLLKTIHKDIAYACLFLWRYCYLFKKHDSYAGVIGGQEFFFKDSEWEYMGLV